MLEMRPNCETCDRDLPADKDGALICSFECTFCERCNHDKCPNCGGPLMPRPARSGEALLKYPASIERVVKTA